MAFALERERGLASEARHHDDACMTRSFALSIWMAACLMQSSFAQAQEANPRATIQLDHALAERDATLRLEMREEKIAEGAVMLAFAGASVLGGAATAAIGYQDVRLLSAGLATAGWGVVNGVLALFLLDLSGESLNAASAARLMTGERLFADIEGLANDQGSSALIFALNTGIDIGYVATGILLAIIGFNARPEDQGLIGYGFAQAAQGLGLFAFDLTCWMRSSQRQSRAQQMITPSFED